MNNRLHWKPRSETSGDVVSGGGKHLATYHWGSERRHPFFHPVYSCTSSEPLTCFAPFDHRWHKGLWWSWKYVNGLNFWDDQTPGGEGEGESRVVEHTASETPDGSVRLQERLEMRVVTTKDILLYEERTLVAYPNVAHLPGAWALDWDLTTIAATSCRLDVTPFPAYAWGGYMGLSFRPNRSMGWGEEIVNSEGASGQHEVHRTSARWAAYGGIMDGDERASASNPMRAGVAIFDHPHNPRHPTPFYAGSSGADNRSFGFLTASFLMHQAVTLEKGECLRLRYRTVFLDRPLCVEAIEEAWRAYQASTFDKV
jgi:hypothetical protein